VALFPYVWTIRSRSSCDSSTPQDARAAAEHGLPSRPGKVWVSLSQQSTQPGWSHLGRSSGLLQGTVRWASHTQSTSASDFFIARTALSEYQRCLDLPKTKACEK
jgi:hypothetical protein